MFDRSYLPMNWKVWKHKQIYLYTHIDIYIYTYIYICLYIEDIQEKGGYAINTFPENIDAMSRAQTLRRAGGAGAMR